MPSPNAAPPPRRMRAASHAAAGVRGADDGVRHRGPVARFMFSRADAAVVRVGSLRIRT